MAKGKTTFFCQSCGNEFSKWTGQCPACKEWNTLVEEEKPITAGKSRSRSDSRREVVKISDVVSQEGERYLTGIPELDRVLGGGLVKGSLTLIGGDPGIGKSTLLLQVANHMAKAGRKVLYISGEESMQQIRLRAERLGTLQDLYLFCETNLDAVEEVLRREAPEVVVIDSIQTMYAEDVASAPGSVSQVREATALFLRLAKGLDISIFLVGHVTKEGAVAGPRVLEHMVDTVLYFEGDRHAAYRILRGVKNRFGSTNEIGVFQMEEEGLIEVENPSAHMLDGRQEHASGSVVTCVLEGSRPMLVEIQALVCPTNFGMPRRTVAGMDGNRVNLLMAVLEKRLHLNLQNCDAYVNIAGGLRMNEPAMDLAVAMALVSSYYNKSLADDTLVFGEIGLSGEIRAVKQPGIRIQEGEKLGFRNCILPWSSLEGLKKPQNIGCSGVTALTEIRQLWK
jgi:DNA repair protein RadA/Sms